MEEFVQSRYCYLYLLLKPFLLCVCTASYLDISFYLNSDEEFTTIMT